MTFLDKELNEAFTFNDLQVVLEDCIYSTKNDNSIYVIYKKPIVILNGNFYIDFKFFQNCLVEFKLQSSEYEFEEAHLYHCKWLEENFKNEKFSSNNIITYKSNNVEMFADRSLKGGNPQISCKVVKY